MTVKVDIFNPLKGARIIHDALGAEVTIPPGETKRGVLLSDTEFKRHALKVEKLAAAPPVIGSPPAAEQELQITEVGKIDDDAPLPQRSGFRNPLDPSVDDDMPAAGKDNFSKDRPIPRR